MGAARTISPLARLVHALREEGIRFQIAGMSAAILQGVPATTLDTDIWVELPERQFVRLTALILRFRGVFRETQGSELLATLGLMTEFRWDSRTNLRRGQEF